MGFVIYDLETSGLNKRFDQILQFAAIPTNDDLEQIAAPVNVRARLLPSIVPSPGALHVTQRSISHITDASLPTLYQAACEIHDASMSWSPSMFLGYNSIRFDEEFLRQTFYQNLRHPIYVTNLNGNNRGDALRLLRGVALLSPDSIAVPIDADGRRSFRLEDLGPANGFNPDKRHDALSDAEATLHLCRLIRDRAPGAWSNFSRFANKSNVIEFIHDEDAFALLGERADSDFFSVTHVGQSPKDKNLQYCLDLNSDYVALDRMSHVELCEQVKDPGGPIRKFRANASPVMAPLWELEDQGLLSASSDDISHLGRQIRSNEDLLNRLRSAIVDSERVWPESVHLEEQIYNGFASDTDVALCQRFHQIPWEDRTALIARFQDKRFYRLGRRLIYHERPDLLEHNQFASMRDEVRQRLDGSIADVPWLTIPTALSEIQSMLNEPISDEDRQALSSLSEYLTSSLRLKPAA
ncbi:exonuclease domain-containing protein (plasmid) [Agrobacterium rosae]|uniref:exonuclease domain-containing protein n=1 Tax=Agrobacterium rosae TaxID=1972867 RepID=UPI002A175DE8|nr:exonuclease domain-containing protein [Agrobacterium rosae]MDX8316755.1 exonuclease domain-containing protein [Agrobacterium rosae]